MERIKKMLVVQRYNIVAPGGHHYLYIHTYIQSNYIYIHMNMEACSGGGTTLSDSEDEGGI